jgi:hypothetical protein
MAFATLVMLLQFGLWLGGDVTILPSATTAIPAKWQAEPDNFLNKTSAAESGSNSPKLTATSADQASENSQLLSLIYVPPIRPAKPERIIPAEGLHERRDWLILSIAQHSAAAFDAYSTRQAISSDAREDDPLMRPFAQSPAIYAAIQGCPVILDFAARRMQRSGNNFIRKTWWLPQSISTGMFLFSGVHNLYVASRR